MIRLFFSFLVLFFISCSGSGAINHSTSHTGKNILHPEEVSPDVYKVLFDNEDLTRLNSKHVKNMSFNDLKGIMKIDFDQNFWDIIKQNINNPAESVEWFKIISGQEEFRICEIFFTGSSTPLHPESFNKYFNCSSAI